MDSVIGSPVIQLTADNAAFKKTINDSIAKYEEFVNAVRDGNKKMTEVTNAWIGAQVKAGTEAGKAYQAYRGSLDGVKQALVNTGQATSVAQKGINSMASATVKANAEMLAASTYLKTLSSNLWVASRGIQQFGTAMLTSFTLPIAAAGAMAVKTYADFEKGTVSIQRAAGITRESADKITQGFVDISTTAPITVSDLQKAGYAAAQAGVTGEKALTNFATAAVKLSQVGGDAFKALPIEDLASNLAKLSIAFGESGNSMEKVNNIASTMLAVSKAVPGGLGEVTEAMRRAAPMASTLHVSLADTAAAMGTLVAAGVPASRAGTEFNTLLSNLVKNIDKVGQALGYSNAQMETLKSRMDTDLMGVLTELISRYNLVGSTVEKVQHLQEIFGEIGLKAMLPLINNSELLADLLARANGEMENGTLLAADFAVQANSLSGTFTVFGNTVQALAYTIGRDLAPYVNYFLKSLSQGLLNVIRVWTSLNPLVKAAIVLFASLVAIIGPLALLINTVFISPISGLITFLAMTTRAVYNLGATTVAAAAATGQMSLFGGSSVMAAGGIGILNVSLGASLSAIGKFVAGMAIAAGSMLTMVAVVVALAAALYMLAKAFGFKVNLPTMPKISAPKLGGVPAGATNPTTGGGEDLNTPSDAEKDAAKAEADALADELKAKKKARDKELKAMQDNIDAYENSREAQEKILKKQLEDAKDAVKQRRDQWEKEKELEDEKIDAQQDLIDATKKTLKAAKKQLDSLKEAQSRDVDTAQGQVDYAEMNLEAAQNNLKRLKILGKDEFDAEYRAAEARVKYWEDAVTLAKQNLIKVKQAYQAQIDAQEDIVTTLEDQVDAQESALDDLKDALDKRTKIVEDEINVLEDEVDARQNALDDYNEATREKLDLMKEEKNKRQEQLDAEIEAMQERVDAAKEQAGALKNMPLPELPKLPDVAGSVGGLNDAVIGQMEDIQKMIAKPFSIGYDENGLFGLGTFQQIPQALRLMWKQAEEDAKTSGQWVVTAFLAQIQQNLERNLPGFKAFEGLSDRAKQAGQNVVSQFLQEVTNGLMAAGAHVFIDAWFGKDSWELLQTTARQKGMTVSQVFWQGLWDDFSQKTNGWGPMLMDMLMNAILPFGIWDLIKQRAGIKGASVGEETMKGATTAVTGAAPAYSQSLTNSLFGDWANISEQANAYGQSVPTDMQAGFSSTINDLQTTASAGAILTMDKIGQGISSKQGYVKSTFAQIGPNFSYVSNDLNNKSRSWGRDFMSLFASGINDKFNEVKKVIESIANWVKGMLHFSKPDFGPLVDVEVWGQDLVKTYADAMESQMPYLEQAFDDMNVGIDRSAAVGSAAQAAGGRTQATAPTNQTVVNRNYYIQPGQMIASRGEVRNFARMLREYDKFEDQR